MLAAGLLSKCYIIWCMSQQEAQALRAELEDREEEQCTRMETLQAEVKALMEKLQSQGASTQEVGQSVEH